MYNNWGWEAGQETSKLFKKSFRCPSGTKKSLAKSCTIKTSSAWRVPRGPSKQVNGGDKWGYYLGYRGS